MSRRTSLIFLALLIPAALVSQIASKNMAVGTWKLNTAKSKFDPGPGPTGATVTIGADNKIKYSEEPPMENRQAGPCYRPLTAHLLQS